MMLIRPVKTEDIDMLHGLTEQATFGLTTLPRDKVYLERRILHSIDGFKKLYQEPGDEAYLFVLEDTETGHVVGTSGIVSKVGGFEPFYAFNIETSIHESERLKVRKEIKTLHLLKEHDGPSEIGSLFLSPEGRGAGHGRLLSLCRFLFIAEFPKYFDKRVIAEMRGVIDARGQSDFWDAVGRHFFDVDFPTADYLSVVDKRFIAELLPVHPIYIPLLPEKAQAVIGRVHENTEPALKMLMREGFEKNGMVDIFEAGPTVECARDEIRAVKDSQKRVVCGFEDEIGGDDYVVSNTVRQFRAVISGIRQQGEDVVIAKPVAELLDVGVGDSVRYVKIRADG